MTWHSRQSRRRHRALRRPGAQGDGVAARGPGKPGHLAAGISLIEMVLVLAILALLSAIAAPRYASSIARYRAEMAARRVAADLALAQARAGEAGRPQSLVFVARSYQMPGVPYFDRKAYGDYTVDLATDPYNVTRVAAEFGGDAQVSFDLYGAPDTGGSVVIEVGDARRVVILHPESGRVEIK